MVGGKRQNVSIFKDLRQENQILEQRRNNTAHRTLNWTCLSFLNQPPSTLLRLCVAMGLAFFRSGEKKAQAHQAPPPASSSSRSSRFWYGSLSWLAGCYQHAIYWPENEQFLLWGDASLEGREKEMDGCMQFGRPKNDPPPHTSFKGRPPQEK